MPWNDDSQLNNFLMFDNDETKKKTRTRDPKEIADVSRKIWEILKLFFSEDLLSSATELRIEWTFFLTPQIWVSS